MKKAIGAIIWVAALCVCLALADGFFRRDDGERKYGSFFKEEQPLDVMFLGSSRVLDGISPMELWRDYGVTSYNMGNSSECIDASEWVLRIASEQNKPKIAVLDVYYIDRSIEDRWHISYRHLFLDEIPLSRIKFEAVRSTIPQDRWIEFLMPFSLYHGRWEEMLAGNVERMIDCEPFMMGSELRIGRRNGMPYERTTEMNTQEQPGTQALYRIVSFCREQGIEPVFMAIPAPVSQKEQMNMNGVQLVADELGVPFVNMYDDNPVNFDTDCYDELGHLNPDGATKVTAYMGEWLTEHYELEDKRSNAAYAHWNDNLELYEEFRLASWGHMTMLE
ncbi:MAG: hypothetical protein J6K32_12115 [Clostridia bacterium]|nr:hypothetical protein [Clostridia bacterium]